MQSKRVYEKNPIVGLHKYNTVSTIQNIRGNYWLSQQNQQTSIQASICLLRYFCKLPAMGSARYRWGEHNDEKNKTVYRNTITKNGW